MSVCFRLTGKAESIADDLLFPGEDGNPLRARKLLESYFVPMIKRAGLRHFRFHDLRQHADSPIMPTT